MTRTRYGSAPWVEDVVKSRRPDLPRYRGRTSSPVVIVGGGLTGVMTAYAFAAAGVKATLLESGRLGHFGAALGLGVMRGEAAASYRTVEGRRGRRAARAIFEASRRAVLDLATTARRLGVRDVDTTTALHVQAGYRDGEAALAKEAAARRAAGLDVAVLKPASAAAQSGVESAQAALRLRDWGQAHPYRLLTGFASAAQKRGVQLFERSPVRRLRVGPAGVEVQTENGSIDAETVVVATGEPSALFRPLARHVRLLDRHVVVTGPLPSAIRRQISAGVPLIADTDEPPHLVRWLDDGRVLITGADRPRATSRERSRLGDKALIERTGQLMYELSRLYPVISGTLPAYGWTLPLATGADGVLHAGPHRNYPRHLFAWATGHDPAQSFLASRILLRHYFGTATRDDACFGFTR